MNQIQVTKVMDNAYNYNNTISKFGIRVDANNQNVTSYTASDTSYGSVVIDFTPINSLISNEFLFSYKYRLKIVGTKNVAASFLLEPGYYTIAPSIFTECTNTILNMDSAAVTVQTGRVVPVLLPYREVVDAAYQTQFVGGYVDLNSNISPSFEASDSFTDKYIYRCDGQDMYGVQRYLNNYFSVISNTDTETILEIRGIVRIPTGITQYLCDDKQFFLNTKSLSLNLNFNNLAKTFKYTLNQPGGPIITSISVVDGAGSLSLGFLEKPTLRIYTCDPVTPFDKNLYYNGYTNYTSNSQNFVETLISGSTTTLSLNNININNIPNYLYLLVRDGDQTNYKSGNGIGIESISIRSDNTALNLFKFNSYDLYEISKKNNYQFDYNTFKNCSVVCLPFSLLFDNNMFYSSASSLNMNFSIEVVIKNTSASQTITNIESLLVFQYDGVMVTDIQSGTKRLISNFVDSSSFLASPVMWTDTCASKKSKRILNGGWLSAILSALPAVISGISTAVGIVKPIAKSLICDQVPTQGAGLMNSSGGSVLSRSSLKKRQY